MLRSASGSTESSLLGCWGTGSRWHCHTPDRLWSIAAALIRSAVERAWLSSCVTASSAPIAAPTTSMDPPRANAADRALIVLSVLCPSLASSSVLSAVTADRREVTCAGTVTLYAIRPSPRTISPRPFASSWCSRLPECSMVAISCSGPISITGSASACSVDRAAARSLISAALGTIGSCPNWCSTYPGNAFCRANASFTVVRARSSSAPQTAVASSMAVAARNEIHFIGADYLPDMAKMQGPGAGCRIQNRPSYLLLPLRQRQDRSLAPDVHAIEEAHAEQGDGQAVVLRDDCVDVIHRHVANAHRVELETISGHIAVGRFHHDLLAFVVIEPEAARLARGKRDECRAGIHSESNRHTVHFAVGDQFTPFVCRDLRVVGGRRGARLGRGGGACLRSRSTQSERHVSTLDIERCAISRYRQQDDVVACLLSNGEGSQGTAFDLHQGFAWEQANDVDVQRGCSGRDEQADG